MPRTKSISLLNMRSHVQPYETMQDPRPDYRWLAKFGYPYMCISLDIPESGGEMLQFQYANETDRYERFGLAAIQIVYSLRYQKETKYYY